MNRRPPTRYQRRQNPMDSFLGFVVGGLVVAVVVCTVAPGVASTFFPKDRIPVKDIAELPVDPDTAGIPKDVPYDLRDLADEEDIKYNFPPGTMSRLITQESHWNPRALSDKGCKGLTQLSDSISRSCGLKNPYDPEGNVKCGARHLRNLIKHYHSIPYALVAYNGSPEAVAYFKKHGGVFYDPKKPVHAWARETANYVRSIYLNGLGEDLAENVR